MLAYSYISNDKTALDNQNLKRVLHEQMNTQNISKSALLFWSQVQHYYNFAYDKQGIS